MNKGLEENIYEEAFSKVMTILSCENHPLFDHIAFGQEYFESNGHKFLLIKSSEAWTRWLTQNIRVAQPSEL